MNEKEFNVKDGLAERGIKLNNVISSGIFGVLAWVGVNIDTMKESIADVKISDGIMKSEIIHLHEKVDDHELECFRRIRELEVK